MGEITSQISVLLLELEIDSKLNFNQHVSKLCNKSARKFYFTINTSQRKLYKAWKITNLSKLNVSLSKQKTKKKKKQTNKPAKS